MATLQAARAPLTETLRLPATALSAAVFILYCGLEASSGAWLYTLLHEGHGISTASAGAAVSVFWASLMAARVVFGLVHVAGPVARWLVACMSVCLLAALGFSFVSHSVAGIAASAVIGFACGPIFPWLIAETPQRLGARHGANAIGVQIASAAIGLTLAPTLIGVLGDRYGVTAIPWGLTVLAALLLIAFGALERSRRALAYSHWRAHEGWRELAFRLDTFWPTLSLLVPAVAIGCILTWSASVSLRELGSRPAETLPNVLAVFVAFGIAQQYVMLGFIFKRVERVAGGQLAPTLTALLFALLHLPNLFLTTVTFVWEPSPATSIDARRICGQTASCTD